MFKFLKEKEEDDFRYGQVLSKDEDKWVVRYTNGSVLEGPPLPEGTYEEISYEEFKEYKEENKDKIKQIKIDYRKNNKDKCEEKRKEYYILNYDKYKSYREKYKNENPNDPLPTDLLVSNFELKPLFKNQEHINLIKDAMFSSSNEPGGTSYRHRFEDPKFTFAGKTGSSQIKKFTEEQREAEVKQESLPYKDRDHALFVAFAPYDKPKYAISVLVEHGGSGSKAAAPLANKLIKKIIDRDKDREIIRKELKII